MLVASLVYNGIIYSLTGPRAFSLTSTRAVLEFSSLTKKSSSIFKLCFLRSMTTYFIGSISERVLSLIILTSLRWVITLIRWSLSDFLSALVGGFLIPSVTSVINSSMFPISLMVLFKRKLVYVLIHSATVFCNSLISGVALILSHPISTVYLRELMLSFVLVKEVIVSSKCSRSGFLVWTPSKILSAIHPKVSSSTSSPSTSIKCFSSFGSFPVFKNLRKLSDSVSFQRNSLSLYWLMNSLVASLISLKLLVMT